MDCNSFCESIPFASIVVMSRKKWPNLSYYTIISIKISFSFLNLPLACRKWHFWLGAQSSEEKGCALSREVFMRCRVLVHL